MQYATLIGRALVCRRKILLPVNILSFEAIGTSMVSLFQSTSRTWISSLEMSSDIKVTNFLVTVCKLMTCKWIIKYHTSWCRESHKVQSNSWNSRMKNHSLFPHHWPSTWVNCEKYNWQLESDQHQPKLVIIDKKNRKSSTCVDIIKFAERGYNYIKK